MWGDNGNNGNDRQAPWRIAQFRTDPFQAPPDRLERDLPLIESAGGRNPAIIRPVPGRPTGRIRVADREEGGRVMFDREVPSAIADQRLDRVGDALETSHRSGWVELAPGVRERIRHRLNRS